MNQTQNSKRNEIATLPEQTVQPQMFRFDKNLAGNGPDFSNSFGAIDGQMVFEVVFYIACTYQKNLFSYGRIYPADFAKAMGYTRDNLFKKHPNPAQISKSTQLQKEYAKMESEENYNQKLSNGENLFYTMLDNALYLAGKENLKFSYEVKNFEKRENIQRMKFIQLLTDVNKHYDINNKNKIYYTYKLSPTIESHLSKYFMLASPDAIKPLRKKNSVYLYFYLKNLQHTLRLENNKIGTPYFDLLCSKAEINIAKPKDRKQKLIYKLNKIRETTDLKFDYRFVKGKGKFEYNIEIEFHDNMKAISKEENHEIRSVAFEDNYLHGIKNFYLDNIHNKTNLKWKEWNCNNKYNLKEKIEIFLLEYNKMYRPIDKNSKVVLNYFELNFIPF